MSRNKFYVVLLVYVSEYGDAAMEMSRLRIR